MRPAGRWVYPEVAALKCFGLSRGCCFDSDTHCWSLGSSGVVEFNQVRPDGRWFHQGTLRELLRVFRIMRGIWVQLHAPWMSLGSFGAVGFTSTRPGGRWVNPAYWRAPLGSLGSVVVFIRGLWIHSRALGFMQRCWVHTCAPLALIGSSGVVGFILGLSITRVRPGGRWVNLRLLGSIACALGVVGIIRSPQVQSRTP